MNENTENSPLNDDPLPGTLPGWLPYLLTIDEDEELKRLRAEGMTHRAALKAMLSPRSFALIDEADFEDD